MVMVQRCQVHRPASGNRKGGLNNGFIENYERRIDKINGFLAQYGISSVEECREICKAKGFVPVN